MGRSAKKVDIGTGLTLSYAVQGRGDPIVIFLPGLTDSWRSYEPVLDRLPVGITAYSVSARGHGDSSKPETGYGTEEFASDVVAFMDSLGIGRAFIVGHSSASLIARRVAIQEPDRAAGVVLIGSPTTLQGNAVAEAFLATALSDLDDPIDSEFAKDFAVGTFTKPLPAAFIETVVEEMMKVPARVWREAFARVFREDDTRELSRIGCPALLVWGDQDSLVGRDAQDFLLDAMAGARLSVFEGVGHSPHWEDPARFAAELTGFLLAADTG